MTVRFTIFDWKWLSNLQYVSTYVSDANQLAGIAEASIDFDFSNYERTDKNGDSLIVAGGRIYFESEIMGAFTTTLTGKGFFDKLGYVEPPAPGKSKTGLILAITLPIGAVLLGSAYYLYKKRADKKKKALTHID